MLKRLYNQATVRVLGVIWKGTPVARRESDFSDRVRRVLAERACYICSNPDCRRLTAGPHTDPGRAVRTGRASHIHAASPNGPRFDPNQTDEQRKSAENGIWLCADHADKVDDDEARYPATLLRNWKRLHEQWIDGEGWNPPLPLIRIQTRAGLSLDWPGTDGVSGVDCETLREHVLVIQNQANRPFRQLVADLQFPELIKPGGRVDGPPGLVLAWKPQVFPLQVNATGGGTARGTGLAAPGFSTVRLGLEALPPKAQLAIKFRSIVAPTTCFDQFRMEDEVERAADFWLAGSLQFQVRGEWISRRFVSVIQYDRDSRTISSGPCQEDTDDVKLRIRCLMMFGHDGLKVSVEGDSAGSVEITPGYFPSEN